MMTENLQVHEKVRNLGVWIKVASCGAFIMRHSKEQYNQSISFWKRGNLFFNDPITLEDDGLKTRNQAGRKSKSFLVLGSVMICDVGISSRFLTYGFHTDFGFLDWKVHNLAYKSIVIHDHRFSEEESFIHSREFNSREAQKKMGPSDLKESNSLISPAPFATFPRHPPFRL